MLKVLEQPKRSSDREGIFHILCQEIGKTGAGEKLRLFVSADWENTLKAIRAGSKLVVIGKWERSKDEISLDEDGLIVLEPETVIPASILSEVSFCPRAYAAKEQIPPLEMNYPILLGTLLHHVFAALLSSDKPSAKKYLARQAIEKHRNSIAETPFAPSEEGIALDILSHLERIEPWLQSLKKSHSGWEIRVEEALQSQSLGLKGRIDGVLIHKSNNAAVILELKTSRAGGLYPPLAHQLQLTCYALLIEELILQKRGNVKCFVLYSNEPQYFIEREAFPNSRRQRQSMDIRNLIIGIKKGWYIPPKESQPQCPTCHFAEGCVQLT